MSFSTPRLGVICVLCVLAAGCIGEGVELVDVGAIDEEQLCGDGSVNGCVTSDGGGDEGLKDNEYVSQYIAHDVLDDGRGEEGADSGGRSETGRCGLTHINDSAPLTLGPQDTGLVLSRVKITNPDGVCVKISGAKNVTIKDSLFVNCKIGVFADEATDIAIVGNRFEDVGSAVKIWHTKGGVRVSYNEYRNIGVIAQKGGANFVELNRVSGSAISVNNNVGECVLELGCDPEDLVSIFKSEGSEDSPIEVVGNRFRGRGFSESGSGIVAGDYGGGYIAIRNNILINPGQVGIAIAGGHDISIEGNTLYHDADPRLVSSAPILVGKWGGEDKCYGHKLVNNHSNWYSSRGKERIAWWPFGESYNAECARGIVENRNNTPDLNEGSLVGYDEKINRGVLPRDIFSGLSKEYFSSCE